MTNTLYCFGESGNAYKAALCLTLAGVPWQPRFVDFFNGEARGAEFRAINPMGEVPVLDAGGKILTQSGLIQTWVMDETGKLAGASAADRQEILRWILFDNQKVSGTAGPLLLYDAIRNKYFSLGLTAFKLIKNWKGGEDIKNFEKKINSSGIDTSEEEIKSFISFLHQNNLIIQPTGQNIAYLMQQKNSMKKSWLMHAIHNYLFFKIPLFKPDDWLSKTLKYVKHFASKKFRNLVYFFGFIGLFLVVQQLETFKSTFLYFFSFQGLMLYFLTLVFVKCLHELGHAYIAKYYGCRVSAIGIAFLVFFPFLYTDTTDAWRLRNHKERLLINFGGILTELHLALIATFIWAVLPDGGFKSAAFFLATTSWISSLTINVSPFMRFDGYYVFSDWLRAENLQPRSFALARWKIRESLFGLNHPPPEEINPSRRWTFIVYAWATWVYRFFLFLGIALLVYHFA